MRNLRLLLQRFAHAQNLLRSGGGECHAIKHSLSSNNGTSRVPLSKKLQIGVRCFSSTEPTLHTVVQMPALSPTMSQGNLAKWRKKEGEKINVGDVVCEIETDKATLEFECLEEGFLARILTPEGSKDVPVGQPICITVEDSDDIEKIPASISSSSEQKDAPINDVEKETIEPKKMSRISPSAKLLISEFGLDTSLLVATGPHGTLLKGDVLAAIKSGTCSSRTSDLSKTEPSTSLHEKPSSTHPPVSQPKSSPSLIDMYKDIPNSQIRKVIAKRLMESKMNSPHLYLSKDVILDQLLAFRNVLKEQHNVKVSINDIIIKAVALALRSVPQANATWNDEKEEATLCNTVDISIAVATDKGLMTPIVRNADSKTLSTISLEVKELAEKARSGKLKPNEFQGGTFSISNLGMFPVDHFCAIINPPQACILAVGRGIKVIEPVLGSDGIEKPAVVTKMNLTLSADHRVFDGDIGGKFLSALSSNLTDVQRLLL